MCNYLRTPRVTRRPHINLAHSPKLVERGLLGCSVTCEEAVRTLLLPRAGLASRQGWVGACGWHERASSDAPTYPPRRGGGTRSMEREERSDRDITIEERFANYEVYDQNYEKIGKVDDLFLDENDNPEYIGVKMGFLGTRSTLIPMAMVRVNDERHLLQVAADKDKVKDGPTFDDEIGRAS